MARFFGCVVTPLLLALHPWLTLLWSFVGTVQTYLFTTFGCNYSAKIELGRTL